MAGARSRRKTGTHFSGSRSKLEFKGRLAPKKEARPKGPGTPCSLRRNIVRNCRKTMVYSAIAERFVGVKLSQIGGYCRILQRLNELAMAGMSWRRRIGPASARSGAFMH